MQNCVLHCFISTHFRWGIESPEDSSLHDNKHDKQLSFTWEIRVDSLFKETPFPVTVFRLSFKLGENIQKTERRLNWSTVKCQT